MTETANNTTPKWYRPTGKEQFAIVPLSLMLDDSLSNQDRRVFIGLALHADKSGKCNPSQERLADITGVNRFDVSRAIGRLVALGWIVKKKRQFNAPCIYWLGTPSKEMRELSNRKKDKEEYEKEQSEKDTGMSREEWFERLNNGTLPEEV